MKTLTADTKITIKRSRPALTGDTKIRLSQIKDLVAWVEDKKYQVGQISEKTGLLKTAEGWVKPQKTTRKVPKEQKIWIVPKSLGARAKEYTAKEDIEVRKGAEHKWTLKEGSKVENIELIAKGHGIKKVAKLIDKYKRPNGKTTNATDWSKKKGQGIVIDKEGYERSAELHWYECQGMGKFDFKVKKWNDEK